MLSPRRPSPRPKRLVRGAPHATPAQWNFDLKAGIASSAKKMTKAEERMLADRERRAQGEYAASRTFIPTNNRVDALQTENFKTGKSFTAQPKMYGGADQALDTDAIDWANNGLGKA